MTVGSMKFPLENGSGRSGRSPPQQIIPPKQRGEQGEEKEQERLKLNDEKEKKKVKPSSFAKSMYDFTFSQCC